MTPRTIRAFGIGFLTSLCLALPACGGDDDHGEEDHSHGGEPTSASCAEISDACHDVDTGTGTPNECHELAHHDVEADCAARKDECLAACVPT